MANLVDMGIIEMAIIRIISTEIMEIDKEGVWTILLSKKMTYEEWLSIMEATFKTWE